MGFGDEPVTPAGRFFLQPSVQQVINSAIGVKDPIDVEATKEAIRSAFLDKHPRFSSILVRDRRGREHWRKADRVDLDRHVFVVPDDGDGNPKFVSEYVASLTVSTPLDLDKPLWEIHVLPSHRCFVMRFHHALGDGISLMSFFIAGCRRADDSTSVPEVSAAGRRGGDRKKAGFVERAWRVLMVLWYSLIYIVDFMLHSLWVRDGTTPISGGEGVELWPRRVEFMTLSVDDMKVVKNAAGATINDVLLGVVSLGLTKYLELQSLELKKPIRITGLAMMNTRPQSGLQDLSNMTKNASRARWGNQFGYMLLPMYLQKDVSDPLQHVRNVKAMTDKKKLSLEAHFSYRGGALIMSLLGPKVATTVNYRVICNTTFTITNVMGPSEEMLFAGNPVTYIRTTSNGLPHALIIHMVSYMGKAYVQIQVAKDIIQESEVLMRCFEDALADMKDSALLNIKKEN